MLRRMTGFFMVGTATQLVAILAGIVQARTLGPDGKSVLAYAAIGLALILTATDGFTAALLTQSGRDKQSARLVHAAFARVVLLVGVPVTAIVMLAGIAWPSQRPLIGAALAIPFGLYLQGTRGLLLAAGRARAVMIQDGLNTVVFGVVLMPLLIFAHLSAYSALGLWVLGWIVSATYGFAACRSLDRDAKIPARPEIRAALLEQLRRGLKNGAASTAGYINLRIDVFLVSAVLGARELGIYTLAVASGELLWSLSQPVVWSNLDRVSGAPLAEATALVVRLTRNMLAMQIIFAVIAAAVGPWLIELVYGPRFALSGLVLQCLLPGIVIYAARSLMGYFIIVRLDRPMLLVVTQGLSALVCALISLATFKYLGLIGAAVATSVTYIIVVAVITAVFCRTTGTAPRELLLPTRDDIRWYKSRAIAATRSLARGLRAAGSQA
ncbi:MAG TPA: hypothetical protein VIK27_01145 [Candidatus Aquilonibacter sp.]